MSAQLLEVIQRYHDSKSLIFLIGFEDFEDDDCPVEYYEYDSGDEEDTAESEQTKDRALVRLVS